MQRGFYNIRPMYGLTMGLHTASGDASIATLGTSDYMVNVGTSFTWKIEGSPGSFKFLHTGSSALALKAVTAGNGYYSASTGVYSAGNDAFLWSLDGPVSVNNQVLLLDANTGESVSNTKLYLDPGESKTIAELNWTTSVVCAYNLDQTVTWYSGNSSIRVDDATGTITAMTPGGTASISPKHRFNGIKIGPSYAINVKPVPDGEYLLRSRAYNRYIQIDNYDSANNYGSSGAVMRQWEYDGGDYQKWRLQWRGNGYYSIISAKSGMALSVPAEDVENTEAVLVQEPYCGYSRQLWKITITENGYYKIKAKSAEDTSEDMVMSVGYHVAQNSNSVFIEQCEYSADGLYDDEWFICSYVDIGMSTDSYTNSSIHSDLYSYEYADFFYSELNNVSNKGPFSITHRYNHGSVHTASIADFSEGGAISYDIDFMVYIGHGYAASTEAGNYMHYNYTENGVGHTGGCMDNAYNVFTSQTKFGSSTSDLRWVWLYTCNFLNTNNFVTDRDLKEMMDGAHIVMGYATQALLCEPNVTLFAQYLQEGKPIIDAYFEAGRNGEANHAHDNHLQKVLYISQCEKETIFSPMIHYEYDASDIMVKTSYIMEDY